MMKFKLTLLLLCFYFVSTGQNSVTRQLDKFDELNVGQGIEVNLIKGNKESCEITVSGMDIEDVITEVSGRRLKIRLARNRNYRNVRIEVDLTYVELDELDVSSGAQVNGKNRLKTENLTVEVSSGAKVEIEVEVEELEITLSSSGNLSVEGSAKMQDIKISSAGGLNAYDLESEDVSASISSAGYAKITAKKRLDAKVSSAGSLKYKGNPERTNVNSSSGGSIRKMR